MGNSVCTSGVYRNMKRAALVLVACVAAWSQGPRALDPVGAVLQKAWQAQGSGGSAEVAARREEARDLLRRAPADSPRFAGWAQQVANLYRNAGWNAQARAVLEESLGRVASLPETSQAKISLSMDLAEDWWRDGNLLRAVPYMERAAAAQAAAPPPTTPQASQAVGVLVSGPFFSRTFGPPFAGSAINTYIRLASLYQQLGRPDAAAATAAKIRALGSTNPRALAQFYEQQQDFDSAVAIYRQMAETATEPQAAAEAWQSTASVRARQQRWSDAVDAMQKAVAAVHTVEHAGNQSIWMRSTLASYMQSGGMHDEAQAVYTKLLQEVQGQPDELNVLGMYARYLSENGRGVQGEKVLKDYLASHADLDPGQKTGAYYQLANVARTAQDTQTADEAMKAAEAAAPRPTGPQQFLIGPQIQKAQAALREHRTSDAFALAMDAMAGAPSAADRQQIDWQVPQIAQALAANKEGARAEQLFQRLIGLALSSAAYNRQALVTVRQAYARFVMAQPARAGDVAAAIESYRAALEDANGADSGSLAEPVRLRLEFAREQSQWQTADSAGRELLDLQESLSGNTSEAYLNDLMAVANTYDAQADYARALPLRRRALELADLHAAQNPALVWRRVNTRMELARTLAQMGQKDEAEALHQQAAALQKSQGTQNGPLIHYAPVAKH